jgi:hypothetical protein
MTNEFIFGAQIASIIGYMGVVFILYRILVSAKEATISTKDATIELLKERIEQLENIAPDILLERTTTRLKAAYEEIERLTEEKQIEINLENTALQELGNITEQTIGLQKRLQILQSIDPVIEKILSFPSTAVPSTDPPTINDDEEGPFDLSVQYTIGDSSEKYPLVISVDEASYTFHRGDVKIFFDFSVDLKNVPSGSALAIGDIPFTVGSRNVYEFKVRQTGLNHSEDLTVSAKRHRRSFDLLYVTDGSEGSVRIWGYIAYDCGEKSLWHSPDP